MKMLQESSMHIRGNELPTKRWIYVFLGTLLSLSVYYLNYGAEFDEGRIDGGSRITVLARVLSVFLIVYGLRPYHLRVNSAVLLLFLYGFCGLSFLVGLAIYGEANDAFFLNTLIQLPILGALALSVWTVDYSRWLRFFGWTLFFQVLVDINIWISGASLWLSKAFVGGVGNPSSFGLLCGILVAFYFFHPNAGKGKWILIPALAFAAVMTKSLFTFLMIVAMYLSWSLGSWRRAVISGGVLIALATFTGASIYLENDEWRFLTLKLNSLGAAIGVVDYNAESSTSVSQRISMHQDTFEKIADEPFRLLTGHLGGNVYWPMDSQLLTYLGSFGAFVALAFITLLSLWAARALRFYKVDGGFAIWAILIFILNFATNRILDYFPVATIFFITIAMILQYKFARNVPPPYRKLL